MCTYKSTVFSFVDTTARAHMLTGEESHSRIVSRLLGGRDTDKEGRPLVLMAESKVHVNGIHCTHAKQAQGVILSHIGEEIVIDVDTSLDEWSLQQPLWPAWVQDRWADDLLDDDVRIFNGVNVETLTSDLSEIIRIALMKDVTLLCTNDLPVIMCEYNSDDGYIEGLHMATSVEEMDDIIATASDECRPLWLYDNLSLDGTELRSCSDIPAMVLHDGVDLSLYGQDKEYGEECADGDVNVTIMPVGSDQCTSIVTLGIDNDLNDCSGYDLGEQINPWDAITITGNGTLRVETDCIQGTIEALDCSVVARYCNLDKVMCEKLSAKNPITLGSVKATKMAYIKDLQKAANGRVVSPDISVEGACVESITLVGSDVRVAGNITGAIAINSDDACDLTGICGCKGVLSPARIHVAGTCALRCPHITPTSPHITIGPDVTVIDGYAVRVGLDGRITGIVESKSCEVAF